MPTTSNDDLTTVPIRDLHLYALEVPPGVEKDCPVCFAPFDYKVDPSDVDTVEFDGVLRNDVSVCLTDGDYVFVHFEETRERVGDGFTEEDVVRKPEGDDVDAVAPDP